MMKITPYHARYFANEITCRRTDDNRLSQSLFDAKVDLNPHQIDAALFALKNPLQEGVMLADEVGLGKTIEAGLVLCQMWAERKRNLLIVCPAILRKQWETELADKFNLPTQVVDKTVVTTSMKKVDGAKLFNFCKSQIGKNILIVSHQYATKEMVTFRQFDWDFVVIDEAHKMRNAYKADNKMGQAMRKAFGGKRKILLTATPLQNSLMELYGLSTLLDEHIFGDRKFFQKEFVRRGNLPELKHRMATFIKRTLRKDVLEYIRYTERKTFTQEFTPTNEEHQLYEAVSEFLRKESSYALPKTHKHLTALILRKLLASSPFAVVGTLKAILDRLLTLQATGNEQNQLILEDIELTVEDNEAEELELEEYEDALSPELNTNDLNHEIAEIKRFIRLAESLIRDSKVEALLQALQTGFSKMDELNAPQKAIIFTESVRTQQYLYDFLTQNGYQNNVVMFSGINNDESAVKIYQDWLIKYKNSSHVTGSADVDKRTALIDYFRDDAQIMIATEAASEGVNLQFCSLLINYDLPWNPQRVEQRIGRCHRYGQKFDVVVINFLNKRNKADQRVLELLTEKFKLFQGVLGASDEVLGQIESGVDIENRIANIYATCRTEEEIQKAFDELQNKFADEINSRIKETQNELVSSFDQSVLERLKVMANDRLNSMELWFWQLSQFALADKAIFNQSDWYFLLQDPPNTNIPCGRYLLPRKVPTAEIEGYEYRLTTPLGEWCIEQGLNAQTANGGLVFDYTNYPEKVSQLAQYQGKSGWLRLDKIIVKSAIENQERLVFTVIDNNGNLLDTEFAQKLFLLSADVENIEKKAPPIFSKLNAEQLQSEQERIRNENKAQLSAKIAQINAWAKDQMQAAEDEIAEIKDSMREKEKQVALCDDVKLQITLQEEVAKLRKSLRKARNQLDDVQDEISAQELALLKELKEKVNQTMTEEKLFEIYWQII